jgi:hypothetical protein
MRRLRLARWTDRAAVAFALVWLVYGLVYGPWTAAEKGYVIPCPPTPPPPAGFHPILPPPPPGFAPVSAAVPPPPAGFYPIVPPPPPGFVPASSLAPTVPEPVIQHCPHWPTKARDRLGYMFWEMGQLLGSARVIPLLFVPLGVWLALRLAVWTVQGSGVVAMSFERAVAVAWLLLACALLASIWLLFPHRIEIETYPHETPSLERPDGRW